MSVTRRATLTHLDELEAEAIHILREVAAELERPVLLFSGGKDSIVLLRLAEKAFRPGKFPFPVMHVDTGHNFPEVIEFRDRRVAELGERLIVASRAGVDRQGPRRRGDRAARVAQPAADDDAARRDRGARFDAAIGGARRDEERARAKERIFSLPRRLRPVEPARAAARALEPLQRARPQGRARARLPDLELDGARRLAVRRARAARAAVDLLRARARGVPARRDALRRAPTSSSACRARSRSRASVRFRTVGDMTCTGGVVSDAATIDEVVDEIAATRVTERGETRADDRVQRGRDGGPQACRLFLSERRQAELLRLVTCGSVDDGKSTLIGRLLYDTKQIFVDQLEHIEETSKRRGDGVRQPRAAHRRPARRARAGDHDRRRLPLVRDAAPPLPARRRAGPRAVHAQHGHGRLDRRRRGHPRRRAQRASSSRRAATRTSPRSSRIPHVVVAVNKMDLVDLSQERFDEIARDLRARSAARPADLHVIPISALQRRQRRRRARERCRGTTGRRCSSTSRRSRSRGDRNLDDRRFPVQWVIRPMSDEHHDYRGYAGQVAGGVWRAGDEVVVLPSGLRSRVEAVETADGPLEAAVPPQSVTIRLEDDVDVSRGDMLADPRAPADRGARARGARLLDERAAARAAREARRQAHDALRARDRRRARLASSTSTTLDGRRRARAARAERHRRRRGCGSPSRSPSTRTRENRATGAFILIDEATNDTVGAGHGPDRACR